MDVYGNVTLDYAHSIQSYVDRFDFNEAPLRSFYWPFFGGWIYLATIFSLQSIITKPWTLKYFSVFHNLFLCLLSLAMLLGIFASVIKISVIKGPFYAYCDVPSHPLGINDTGSLTFWCYVFYASKYYEMVDTIILVLKKKPLTLVHVYHHFIVPHLFWSLLETKTTSHWILVAANCAVHVAMYYYYMVFTLGYDVWWKRYLTQMQIVQFFMDIMSTWPALMSIFVFDSWTCQGQLWPVIFGHLVGLSFIYLFTAFYISTYRAQKRKAREEAASKNTKKTQ